MKGILIVTLGIFVGLPLLSYFVMKFGTYGYSKGKQLANKIKR